MIKQFGGKASKIELEKLAKSKHWDGKKFENLQETKMDFRLSGMPKFFKKQFLEKEGREPKTPIPIEKFNKDTFLAPSEKAKFIWYGHSVVLMRINGKTLLIDPMFGPNAAPIAPFKVKRFSENTLNIIDELPEIDLVLFTHDHYDHIDLKSVKRLKSKVKQYFVALGVKRHLTEWGIDNEKIIEFDWWKKQSFDDITITFTPTRHFSGRGLTDRAKSLWGGWAFKTQNENIWFSGDGGFGNHFTEIGKKLGPFDFGFMECGQYNENWHAIHMYPEESVQAAIDAKVTKIMPVHWAGFTLAQHHWKEPIERFMEASIAKKVNFIAPKIGEIVELSAKNNLEKWWENIG
ncbi:MBL fold metallo-hydrolase [Lacihabitans sp. LS3-19]|uniref:MBL fold metallo-hydrolase n=1 Tax=Lacihabitans sp. LS3-19 TaxID=2487335 RepID=UPI0020CE6407|nr:MBL fold metallo-hydrolase [Lacihabitans sp. LS3-19]MCP9768948.1 MBL fold metallo-hydrolase [Lacihabitans sp. LS3-19]